MCNNNTIAKQVDNNDIVRYLDINTPSFKHQFETCGGSTARYILHFIAVNWNPIGVGELVNKTRLSSKEISAYINNMMKKELVVVSHKVGKNNMYQMKNRMLNLWYMYRNGIGNINKWIAKSPTRQT